MEKDKSGAACLDVQWCVELGLVLTQSSPHAFSVDPSTGAIILSRFDLRPTLLLPSLTNEETQSK